MNAKELKEWREHYLLSQQDLADIFGINVTTVSRWERGIARIPAMVDLAAETLTQQRARMVSKIREKRAIRQSTGRRRAARPMPTIRRRRAKVTAA